MKIAHIIAALAFTLLSSGCTYYGKTGKTRFTPLGAEAQEVIDTVAHDVKKCTGRHKTCKKKTSHDGYEESKIKSMTNEEFIKYVEKQKAKSKK